MSGIVKEETRSASPHCPKPNESEEPEGTSVEEPTTEKCHDGEMIITKEMEEEEKHLTEEGGKKEKEMMEEARQSWQKDSQEMRFRRLQHLLEKSNIYSKFLLTKMEQQQQEEKIKKERLEKKAASQSEKGTNKKTAKVERKKREREEDYKIADVMSKEEILSKTKKPKLEADANVSVILEAEDIEKLSDSNSDIKGRLSEALRESSKQMLDPERKVNGQPVPAQQPKLLTGGVMRWYQVEGIEWLRLFKVMDHFHEKPNNSPESVRQRTDFFYMKPEVSASLDSPLWFSSTPLEKSTLARLLTRVLLVREIYKDNQHEEDGL